MLSFFIYPYSFLIVYNIELIQQLSFKVTVEMKTLQIMAE